MNITDVKNNPFLLDRLNHSGKQMYHNQGYKGKHVVICLIDSGVNAHSEFTGVDVAITGDTMGHGTAMCSNICGINVGMAPESKVIVYRREDEYLYSVVNGLKYARNWRGTNGEKVNIVSLSISSSSSYGDIYTEIKACTDAGILVVCSSGNSGTNDITFPASYDETMCVASCTNKQEIATWETSGSMVDICWYGEKVITANWKDVNGYDMSDGTSSSTACVAGLCALYYCKYFAMFNSYPTPQEAKRFMMQMSVDLGVKGKDNYFGWGFATLDGQIHKRIELKIDSNQMIVNGYPQTIPQAPFITTAGSTVVPVRSPYEAFGATVLWNQADQSIIITK